MDKDCAFIGEYGWDLCKPQYRYEQDDCDDDGVPSEIVPAAYLGALTIITAEEGRLGFDCIIVMGLPQDSGE